MFGVNKYFYFKVILLLIGVGILIKCQKKNLTSPEIVSEPNVSPNIEHTSPGLTKNIYINNKKYFFNSKNLNIRNDIDLEGWFVINKSEEDLNEEDLNEEDLNKDSTLCILIHGLNSNIRSFCKMVPFFLKKDNTTVFTSASREDKTHLSIDKQTELIAEELLDSYKKGILKDNTFDRIVILGHSLGGVLSILLIEHICINKRYRPLLRIFKNASIKIFTLGSPLEGIDSNDLAPFYDLGLINSDKSLQDLRQSNELKLRLNKSFKTIKLFLPQAKFLPIGGISNIWNEVKNTNSKIRKILIKGMVHVINKNNYTNTKKHTIKIKLKTYSNYILSRTIENENDGIVSLESQLGKNLIIPNNMKIKLRGGYSNVIKGVIHTDSRDEIKKKLGRKYVLISSFLNSYFKQEKAELASSKVFRLLDYYIYKA